MISMTGVISQANIAVSKYNSLFLYVLLAVCNIFYFSSTDILGFSLSHLSPKQLSLLAEYVMLKKKKKITML